MDVGTASPTAKLEVAGGDVKISTSGSGLVFPDGSRLTSGNIGGSLPSGVLVMTSSPTPPTSFTYTGWTMTAVGGDGTWSRKASIPTAREGLAAVTVGSKIWAIGGYNGSYLNHVQEYDPYYNSWASKPSMNYSRAYLAAAGGDPVAIGGVPSPSTTEYYHSGDNEWRSTG